MSRQEAIEFFERYRDAFKMLDGDAVTALWNLPCFIADSGAQGGMAQVTVYGDDAASRLNWHALCAVYKGSRLADVEFHVLEHVPLGMQHAFTHVQWHLRRDDGSVLQSFRTGYQLVRTEDGIKVAMCTAYQEDLSEMRPDAA